ncbi:hypothetical protein [Marinobacter daepoensis]|nr:hypothetical protein [Marinobacter daepoensis]
MMKSFGLPFLLTFALMLSGCGGPTSPQEVSAAFWQAVIDDDAGEASEFSTLIDEAAFDGFARQWQGVEIDWGRVVIDDSVARVTTRLTGLEGQSEAVETVTYLVRKGDDWLVDYYRTGDALKGGQVWGNLVGQLEKLGEDLKSRWVSQSDDIARELEVLSQELERRAGDVNQEMSVLADEYSERLGEHLEALSDSLRDALKDTPSASPQDQRTLNEAVIRIDDQRARLSEASFQVLAESTEVAAETQLELGTLSDAFAADKAEWLQRVSAMEGDIKTFLGRLNGE